MNKTLSLSLMQEQMHISILSSQVAFGHGIGCLNKPGKPIILTLLNPSFHGVAK